MTVTELDTVEAETATEPRRVNKKELRTARGLLLPAVIFLILLTQVPFVVTIVYSLLRWNPSRCDREPQ